MRTRTNMRTSTDRTGAQTGAGWTSSMVLHASAAFVAAHLVVVLLHELAHVVAGLTLGFSNELFPFGVVHSPAPEPVAETVMLLAAPVFSLVAGVLAMAVQPFRRARGQWHLLWLWAAGMSVLQGAGYLLLTPFGIGDTGMAAELNDLPAVLGWLALVVAVLAMLGTARWFAGPAVQHTDGSLPALRAFTFYPWIVGTVVALALSGLWLTLADDGLGADLGPGSVVAVLMGAMALGVFAPMAMPFTTGVQRRDPSAAGSEPLVLPAVPVVALAVAAVVVLVDLFVLVTGLTIG